MVFLFKWGMIEQELDFIRRRLSILCSSRVFFGYYLFTHLISLETASAQKLRAVCHSSDVQSVLVLEPGSALATDQALVCKAFSICLMLYVWEISRETKFSLPFLWVAEVTVSHILTTFRCCLIFPLPRKTPEPSPPRHAMTLSYS